MSLIDNDPKRFPRRPSFRGNLYLYIRHGQQVIASWPKKRPKKKHPITAAQNEEFRKTMQRIKYLPGNVQKEHIRATQGLALLPRDTLTMMLYNRMCAIELNDGTRIYPMPARQDVSESLDVLAQIVGMILVRGPDFWQGLLPGSPGATLQMNDAGDAPEWGPSASPVMFRHTFDGTTSFLDIDTTDFTTDSWTLSMIARSTAAVTFTGLNFRFNGDAGANYDVQFQFARGGFAAGGAEVLAGLEMQTSGIAGANCIANLGGHVILSMPLAGKVTTLAKRFGWNAWRPDTNFNASGYVYNGAGLWRNGARIDTIRVYPDAGNFVAGSELIIMAG